MGARFVRLSLVCHGITVTFGVLVLYWFVWCYICFGESEEGMYKKPKPIVLGLLVSKFKRGLNWAFKNFHKQKLFSSNSEKKNRLILKRTYLFSDYFFKSCTYSGFLHTDSNICTQPRTYSGFLKNSMNKPRKNRFYFDSTDLFVGILSDYA